MSYICAHCDDEFSDNVMCPECVTSLRAEVARLETERDSREAEYSTALAHYQTELAALVAECDAGVSACRAHVCRGSHEAREEQRESDVRALWTKRPKRADDRAMLVWAESAIRATPLGATPLAERIKELETLVKTVQSNCGCTDETDNPCANCLRIEGAFS